MMGIATVRLRHPVVKQNQGIRNESRQHKNVILTMEKDAAVCHSTAAFLCLEDFFIKKFFYRFLLKKC